MKTICALIIAIILICGCRKKDAPPPPPPPKSIYGFSFIKTDNPSLVKDYHAKFSQDSIYIDLPKGTIVTSLTPTVNYLGASLTPATKLAQDFSHPLLYTVKAKDGTTFTYKVSIRFQDTAKTMTSFIFRLADNPGLTEDIVGIIVGDSISAITPKSVDVDNLKPTIVHSGKSVFMESGRANDFRDPATYTVNAEDSSTRDYKVYTGYRSDIYAVGDDYFLYDLNAFNGTIRWKYNVGPPAGTPVYANGIVYVSGTDNQVFAIDAVTGVLKWKSIPPPGNLNLGMPVFKYDKIYFAGYGFIADAGGFAHFASFIYCVNAQTGTNAWFKELFPGYPYSQSSLTNVIVEDNIACVYDNYIGLYAFNAADGTPVWNNHEMLGHTNPAVANGQIYYGVEGGLAKANLANGQQAWRLYPNNVVYASPSIYNNTIYTAAQNILYAYDINGIMKWQTPFGQYEQRIYAPLVLDNTVYCVNSTKKLIAFNADNGSFRWFRESYNKDLLIANTSIFVTDLNNRINCLDPATGDKKWTTESVVTFPFPFCVVDAKGNARHIAQSGGQH